VRQDFRLPARSSTTRVEAIERVKDWTRGRFQLDDAAIVIITESAPKLPGYPPMQTAVSFWTADKQRHHFSVFKPVDQLAEDDIPPAFMKGALALSEGVSCSCC
jgi:nitrate reductase delta subunit